VAAPFIAGVRGSPPEARAREAAIPRVPRDLAGWGELPPGSNPDRVPDPTLRGAAGVQLIAARLNDPCLAKSAAPAPRAGRPASGVQASAPRAAPSFAPTTSVPDATITVVQTLPPTPDVTASLSPPGIYTNCSIVTRWIRDEGVAQLAPTDTDPEAESAFVQLAAPTLQLHVEWKAEKVGAPPSIPPENIGSNYVLLHETKQPAELRQGNDGVTMVAQTAGSRIYGVRKMSKVVVGAPVAPYIIEQLQALKRGQDASTAAEIEKLIKVASGSAVGVEQPGILPWASAQG
jgi:hypothetical protein